MLIPQRRSVMLDARLRRELDSTSMLGDDEVMICSLVDSIIAILASPVSESAQVLLQRYLSDNGKQA
jgi:hypothetical protein